MKNKDREAVILVTAIAVCSYAYSCLINQKPFFGIDLANVRTTSSVNSFQGSSHNKAFKENNISIKIIKDAGLTIDEFKKLL